MPYLSEDKECIGFLLNSDPDMGFVSTRTLLSGTHKQKVKTKEVQNYNDAITAPARPCSCRKVFISAGPAVSDKKISCCINQFTFFSILQ